MPATRLNPSLYTDIHRVNREFQMILEKGQATDKRNYLCFALPYLLGRSCDKLLSMSFKELKLELTSKNWRTWLTDFEKQIQRKSPWFHTARHNSLRDGLSRRALELILKKQTELFDLKDAAWSYKSLRQAYTLKSLQTGISELKIKYYLNVKDSYNFKPYYQYLDSNQESAHLYLDINP